MILELQFEHKVLVDRVLLRRSRHGVPQQRQSSQREVVLMRLIEEQAEVREHDPELLPAVTVLEFPQQKSAQLVLERQIDGINSLLLSFVRHDVYATSVHILETRAIDRCS